MDLILFCLGIIKPQNAITHMHLMMTKYLAAESLKHEMR